MDLHFHEVRNELLIKKTSKSATFEDVYRGTHIAYCTSRTDLFFAAFDSSMLHLLYMQSDQRRIEETNLTIECMPHIIQEIVSFERRKGIYPHLHFFFVERPCFEAYIQDANRVAEQATEGLPSQMKRQQSIYTETDFEFFDRMMKML